MKKLTLLIIINILISTSFVMASSHIYQNQALEYYNAGKTDEATFLFEKSIVFDPKNTESYIYLGRINQDLENLEKANHYFTIALFLQPDNLELNYLVGEYFYQEDNKDEYTKYVENLEILCPNSCDYLEQIKKLEVKE